MSPKTIPDASQRAPRCSPDVSSYYQYYYYYDYYDYYDYYYYYFYYYDDDDDYYLQGSCTALGGTCKPRGHVMTWPPFLCLFDPLRLPFGHPFWPLTNSS